MPRALLLPLVFLLHSVSVGKQGDAVLFFHPASLISGFVRSFDTNLYLTLQLELSDNSYHSYHLILNPFIEEKSDYYRYDSELYSKLGSGIGIRYYFKLDDGLYCQLMPNAYYSERSISGEDNAYKTVSGAVMNVLGYFGIHGATSLGAGFAFDAGVGYGWDFLKKKQGLVYDINFCISADFIMLFFL
jgi:hypothetical protein